MDIVLTLLGLAAGAFTGNQLAKWKGPNVTAMTAGGALMAIIALPVGLIASPKENSRPEYRRLAFAGLAVWLAVGVAFLAMFISQDNNSGHKATLNKIISDNYSTSKVEVDYLYLPYFGLGPSILGQYTGYFTVKPTDGRTLSHNCALGTYQFEGHQVGDNYILRISAEQGAQIITCGG